MIVTNPILEEFQSFSNWEDRYEYLIELALRSPKIPDNSKLEEYKVSGCTSRVWLIPETKVRKQITYLSFKFDSDSMLVKGLLVLALSVYNNQDVNFILNTEPYFISDLELDKNLTFNRSQGLLAIIKKIKLVAKQNLKPSYSYSH